MNNNNDKMPLGCLLPVIVLCLTMLMMVFKVGVDILLSIAIYGGLLSIVIGFILDAVLSKIAESHQKKEAQALLEQKKAERFNIISGSVNPDYDLLKKISTDNASNFEEESLIK